jgi:uncharacterized protein (TIGR03067 family)
MQLSLRTNWPLIFTCFLFLGAGDQEAKKPDDADKFQGHWTVISYEEEGVCLPDNVTKTWTFAFEGKGIASSCAARPSWKDSGTIRVDSTPSPKSIDISWKTVQGTILGVYEFEGEKLRICFGGPDRPRPLRFASEFKGGTCQIVLVKGDRTGKGKGAVEN